MIKILGEPHYANFRRATGTGRVNNLQVPEYLLSSMGNLWRYPKYINTMTVCEGIDGRLVENDKKTEKARAELVRYSPIMFSVLNHPANKTALRVDQAGSIDYKILSKEDGIISPAAESGYIVGNAASQYAGLAEICTVREFAEAERSGRVGIFSYHDGFPNFRRFRLYLLQEVNSLKFRARGRQ